MATPGEHLVDELRDAAHALLRRRVRPELDVLVFGLGERMRDPAPPGGATLRRSFASRRHTVRIAGPPRSAAALSRARPSGRFAEAPGTGAPAKGAILGYAEALPYAARQRHLQHGATCAKVRHFPAASSTAPAIIAVSGLSGGPWGRYVPRPLAWSGEAASPSTSSPPRLTNGPPRPQGVAYERT